MDPKLYTGTRDEHRPARIPARVTVARSLDARISDDILPWRGSCYKIKCDDLESILSLHHVFMQGLSLTVSNL